MNEQQRKYLLTGAVLIVLGLGVFVLQYARGFGEAVPFLAIGGLFVAGYLYRGTYGLLIPGGILLGLGLGSIAERAMPASVDFDAIGLGVGFMAIYVIALVYAGGSHWWPLIPGVVLIIAGIAAGDRSLEHLLWQGWPLILVVLGILLLVGAFGVKGRWNVAVIVLISLGALAWAAAMRLFAPLDRVSSESSASHVTLLDQTLPSNRLEMHVASANVEITPWEQSDIRVQAIQTHGSPGDFTVEVGQEGDAVWVRDRVTPYQLPSLRRLDYFVSVPKRVSTSVTAGSGNVRIEGVEGDVQVKVGSGNINLNRVVGRLGAETDSGNIELTDGNVATATVRTSSGNITLQGVSNQLTLTTSSGNMRVRDAKDGQLTVAISSGNFEYAGSLASAGMHTIHCASGNVRLRLPDTNSFRLQASASSGNIRNAFPLRDSQQHRGTLSGTVGDGGATLAITVSSGNITLERQ
jgi:hypothetical protein